MSNPADLFEGNLSLPEIKCKTADRFLQSRGLRNFITMFNSDHENVSGDQTPVTVESLQSSFHDFDRLRKYFNQFKITGKPEDIGRLLKLVDELGDRVKKTTRTAECA